MRSCAVIFVPDNLRSLMSVAQRGEVASIMVGIGFESARARRLVSSQFSWRNTVHVRSQRMKIDETTVNICKYEMWKLVAAHAYFACAQCVEYSGNYLVTFLVNVTNESVGLEFALHVFWRLLRRGCLR